MKINQPFPPSYMNGPEHYHSSNVNAKHARYIPILILNIPHSTAKTQKDILICLCMKCFMN